MATPMRPRGTINPMTRSTATWEAPPVEVAAVVVVVGEVVVSTDSVVVVVGVDDADPVEVLVDVLAAGLAVGEAVGMLPTETPTLPHSCPAKAWTFWKSSGEQADWTMGTRELIKSELRQMQAKSVSWQPVVVILDNAGP